MHQTHEGESVWGERELVVIVHLRRDTAGKITFFFLAPVNF